MTTSGPINLYAYINWTCVHGYKWSNQLTCIHSYKSATIGLMCMTPNGPIDGLVCMATRMQPIGLVCIDMGAWKQVNLYAWLQTWTWVHAYSHVTNKSCIVT